MIHSAEITNQDSQSGQFTVFHNHNRTAFNFADGVVESISGAEEIKALPFVRRAYIDDIKIGQKTEKMTYKGARKGPILVQGENREDLEQNIITVQNLLDIKVRKPDSQIAGIVWG